MINGIFKIGFIMIGVLKIIGLLILNKFGKNDKWLRFFRYVDLENIIKIIKESVVLVLLI